mmetsp:Transcript_17138/g.19212  ORF Transcript_17138/g.19212 Transcript_17138/m.19212 type:complete len:82 (+) Transcript_17138:52-297(+)
MRQRRGGQRRRQQRHRKGKEEEDDLTMTMIMTGNDRGINCSYNSIITIGGGGDGYIEEAKAIPYTMDNDTGKEEENDETMK